MSEHLELSEDGAVHRIQVATAGDINNSLGFGTFMNSAGIAGSASGTFNYTSLAATAASTAHTQGVEISLNGGATINLGVLTGSAPLE